MNLSKKLIVSIFLLITSISMLIYVGFYSYQNSNTLIDVSKEISIQKSTDEIVSSSIDKILEKISFGTYDNYSEQQEVQKVLEAKAELYYQDSLKYIYYFFAVTAFFILIFYFLDREFLTLFVALSAMVSLVFALISPLLMVMMHKDLPLVGDVTLSFESKTILTTIEKLYHEDNLLLAGVILLFSILIPLFKSLVILLYGFLKESGLGQKATTLIDKMGKWSMADVFIVSVLVVFFSTKQDIHSSLKIQVGLYFFLGYVLLSMLGSSMIGKDRE